ncbi:unnamed protein product [Caenorhabditis brenneri]
MSLSRPVRFPLLKLPFLCIECVIRSWNIVDIIVFVLFSKKTRQIVKHLKIPLNGIQIFLSTTEEIVLDSSYRKWCFRNESESESIFDGRQSLNKNPLVLEKNAVSLYTRFLWRLKSAIIHPFLLNVQIFCSVAVTTIKRTMLLSHTPMEMK